MSDRTALIREALPYYLHIAVTARPHLDQQTLYQVACAYAEVLAAEIGRLIGSGELRPDQPITAEVYQLFLPAVRRAYAVNYREMPPPNEELVFLMNRLDHCFCVTKKLLQSGVTCDIPTVLDALNRFASDAEDTHAEGSGTVA